MDECGLVEELGGLDGSSASAARAVISRWLRSPWLSLEDLRLMLEAVADEAGDALFKLLTLKPRSSLELLLKCEEKGVYVPPEAKRIIAEAAGEVAVEAISRSIGDHAILSVSWELSEGGGNRHARLLITTNKGRIELRGNVDGLEELAKAAAEALKKLRDYTDDPGSSTL